MDLSDHHRIFIYHWKLFELTFQLPDPRGFPALGPFEAAEEVRLRRYIEMCQRMARSRLWTYPTSWTHSFDGNSTIDRPDDELLTGIVTGFRQIYRDPDASFKRVKNLLAKQTRILREPLRHSTLQGLTSWADAASKLEKAGIGHYADEASALRDRGEPISQLRLDPGTNWLSLDDSFELFGYGDLIHWGEENRQKRAFIRDSPSSEVLFMSGFLELLMGYSMLAIGFSPIVEAALLPAKASTLRG